MKKAQIIKAIQLKSDTHTIKEITNLFNIFIDTVTEELKNGGTIEIYKFLSIKMKPVRGRSGDINGVKWQTEDKILPKVSLSKAFKEATQNESK
jgi:nucleoid DNA-binding protein